MDVVDAIIVLRITIILMETHIVQNAVAKNIKLIVFLCGNGLNKC